MIKKLSKWMVAVVAALGMTYLAVGTPPAQPTHQADGVTWQYTSGSDTGPQPGGMTWQY